MFMSSKMIINFKYVCELKKYACFRSMFENVRYACVKMLMNINNVQEFDFLGKI